MSDPSDNFLKKLIREIHGLSLWQVLGICLIGWWVIYEVAQGHTEGIGLPTWFLAFVFCLLGATDNCLPTRRSAVRIRSKVRLVRFILTQLHGACVLVMLGWPWSSAGAQSTIEFDTNAGVSLPPGVVIDGPPPPIPPATMSRDAESRVTVRALRLSEPLVLDGRLDEAIYGALPITGFFQMEPQDGEPATEETEAWVSFDEENVYVSARVWDSAPESEWIANEMRRNTAQLRQNDSFGVSLDTFYDRRNAYFFYTNPLGARSDRYYTNEGNPNADLLPVWDVRTGRFDGGWTVEMAIPFRSLRYRPGAQQVWGIQLRRSIRRKNEWAYLSPIPISAAASGVGGIFRISMAGTLIGIEAPPAARNIELLPYGISSLKTDRVSDPQVSNDAAADWGLDLKFGITESVTADLTYNTDFAQVEVDEQQVNLTRFPLFFPEKRQFFQEGRGIFEFGGTVGSAGVSRGGGGAPTLFFSRQIGLQSGHPVPIQGGVRVTGEIGRFSVGALNVQTDDLGSLGVEATNFTVVRVKRDVLRRSRIGLIFTGRSVSTVGEGSNQVYGADAAFSLYDNLNFGGYWSRTYTPGLGAEDVSYQAQFNYNPDRYGFQVSHLLVGDNFNPEVGFLRRDDFRSTFASAYFSPRPASIPAVRQFTWQADFNYIENGVGILETREAGASFGIEFSSSDVFSVDVANTYELLEQPFEIDADVTIEPGHYEFTDVTVGYLLGGQRRANGRLSVQFGQFFDGDVRSLGLSAGRIAVLPQFSLEPSASVNRVELPNGSFTTTVLRTRANYSFTPRMFVSGLFQYSSSAETLSTNLRLRWEYSPGSELFIVYTDERTTVGPRSPALNSRALVVKFNRLLRF